MEADEEVARALLGLLEANGYSSSSSEDNDPASTPTTTAAAISKAPQIVKLEMFLQDYPKMLALSFFTALTELRLIDQRIEKIEGLEGCANLKKLWLIENRISAISNLQPATALQELYLTSNRITDITGLEQLGGLQVLWLADNYISSITGISQLVKLQQLNLARNDVSLLGSSLQHNSSLTSLNLADNQLSSLQDVVLGLSSLRSLQEVCLGDPFWGGCPVTSLSNYQTFMLAQLPQLSALDTLMVAPETKAAAAATFAKKQLYYNMRMRTLSRAVGELCRQAQAAQQVQAGNLLEVYAKLAHAAKRLESQIHRVQAEAVAVQQQQQQQGLESAMQAVTQHLSRQDAAVSQDCQAARAALQVATQRLQLELSSAGNIWLEEGRSGDAWMQSCQELLSSSCLQLGGHVQVLSATRIHNRTLRTLFARHMQPGREAQHLLFCDSADAADYVNIAQHGFSCEHNSWRVCPAVKLTSHLDPPGAARAGDNGVMQTLVCRACLYGPCKAVAAAGGNVLDLQQYQSLQAVFCSHVVRDQGGASTATSSRCSSFNRQGTSHQQPPRTWHVFDHTALLPEYIVTWQYVSTPLAAAEPEPEAVALSAAADSSACRDPLLQLCARPLSRWLDISRQQQTEALVQTQQGTQALQERCAAALAAVSALPRAAQLKALTATALVEVAPGQQLQGLTRLCLPDCGCSHFAGLLSHLPSLVVLALPFNKITSLEGLAVAAPTHKLAELDVSHNRISSWSSAWLSGCVALTTLDASFNATTQPTELLGLTRSVPLLQQLDLRFNPVQRHKAYSVTLSALTSLTMLDGQTLVGEQVEQANSLTPALMRQSAKLWHSDAGPVPVLSTLGASDWRLMLHSIVVDGQGVRSLQGLSAACNLVSASFADNLLASLTDLAGCSKLTSLNISSNLITELRPLSSSTSLQQLDVSFNQVSSLSALSPLLAVTQLNCEGNCIASLAALTGLSSLVELYAAHNSLQHIKEVECLCVLPRLMVLDLVGNPLVASTEGYRLLLLYRLSCLKVLDGAAADATELAAAQAQHAGRLTISLLEQHLGEDVDLSALKHLDLSASGLRDLGTVFAVGGPLAGLTSLCLDNNRLASLAPLSAMNRLCVLTANNNTAGSISFAVPPQAAAPGEQGSSSSSPAEASSLTTSMLTSLHTLHLSGCGLTSLVPLQLQRLPALRSLFVQGNELSRLDGLEGLGLLRELVADKNKLRVFEPEALSSLSRLQELHVEENSIRSISTSGGALGLGPPQLRVLLLANNRLMDAADCAQRIAAMPSLLEVSVAGNPFARKQGHRHLFISCCSRLQVIDGAQVTDEEREYVAAATVGAGSPRCTQDMPQYTAATLLAAAAASGSPLAADLSRGAPTALPLGRVAAANHRSGPELSSPKGPALTAPGLPTVLSYEGLANLAAARQNLLGLGGPAGLPGILQTSVPSIQSGVLVLTGTASFGLEGTSMRGSGSSNSGSPAGSNSSSPTKRPGAVARGSNNRRTTTGSIASYRAGGFVVRQATFQH